MATEMTLLGVQKVKGEVDGNPFDFARIYGVGKLPTSENTSGYAGIEIRGEPHIYEKYLKFQFAKTGTLFNVEIDQVAGKSGEFKNMVTSMEPVTPVPVKK